MKLLDRFLGKLAYVAWDTKEGGMRLEEWANLREQQYWSRDQIRELQTQKLNRLVRHAYATSAWYRKIIDDIKLDLSKPLTLADLARFPVTTKTQIRENTSAFISTQYPVENLRRAKTGGSTGVSLNLYFDVRCQQLRNAAQIYADSFSGWEPGLRVAAVWGNPPVPKNTKQKVRAFLLDRMIYLDTMDLNPESMGTFVKRWQEFEPEMIFGHSHSIYVLAKYLQSVGVTHLRPRGIVGTSMMLLDHERSLIESVFGCKVSNRYGCEEVGLIGVECEKHQGMHINSSHIILESLDTNDQPTAPGEAGKLVITDLNNYGMPLFRYRVEDVGLISDRYCSCGRTSQMLERLEGRVADFLKKPDGGQVAGVSLVERTLTKIPGIEQMQFVQEDLHEIIINRVKGPEYNQQTDTALIAELREVFEPAINLVIKDVEKIPQEKSGKYRFSICKV